MQQHLHVQQQQQMDVSFFLKLWDFSLFKILFLFMCECVPACLYVHMCAVSQRPEKMSDPLEPELRQL